MRGRTRSSQGADVNNVANFIDIGKLVGKDETNYHYSASNLSSRRKVEKISIKMRERRASFDFDNFDESVHSRTQYLRQCIKASSYKGPKLKNDGSYVKSIMKKGTASSSSSSVEARVAFSHVDIREYERVPGDNPCVRTGVPLSIGWKHIQHNPIQLDTYETSKGPPRDKIDMIVPSNVRRVMLRDKFGASIKDINAAVKSVNITKRQRKQTLASENIEVLQEVLESAKRKFRRYVRKAFQAKTSARESWKESHDALMNEYLEKALEGGMELDETLFLSAKICLESISCEVQNEMIHY